MRIFAQKRISLIAGRIFQTTERILKTSRKDTKSSLHRKSSMNETIKGGGHYDNKICKQKTKKQGDCAELIREFSVLPANWKENEHERRKREDYRSK